MPRQNGVAWARTDIIGRGNYGVVYSADFEDVERRNAHGKIVVKELNPAMMIRNVDPRTIEMRQKQLNREVGIHSSLVHPNIVRCHDTFSIDDANGQKIMVLVLDYCNKQDLDTLLQRHPNMGDELIISLTLQMASALDYLLNKCPSHPVLHRDIKPGNIFVHSNSDGSLVFRIGDFGLARDMIDDLATTFAGSPIFMAPEVLANHVSGANPAGATKYGATVDLWSLGCVLYRCITHEAPFVANSIGDLIKVIERDAERFRTTVLPKKLQASKLSVGLRGIMQYLIANLLQEKPENRLTIEGLLAVSSFLRSPVFVADFLSRRIDPLYLFRPLSAPSPAPGTPATAPSGAAPSSGSASASIGFRDPFSMLDVRNAIRTVLGREPSENLIVLASSAPETPPFGIDTPAPTGTTPAAPVVMCNAARFAMDTPQLADEFPDLEWEDVAAEMQSAMEDALAKPAAAPGTTTTAAAATAATATTAATASGTPAPAPLEINAASLARIESDARRFRGIIDSLAAAAAVQQAAVPSIGAAEAAYVASLRACLEQIKTVAPQVLEKSNTYLEVFVVDRNRFTSIINTQCTTPESQKSAAEVKAKLDLWYSFIVDRRDALAAAADTNLEVIPRILDLCADRAIGEPLVVPEVAAKAIRELDGYAAQARAQYAQVCTSIAVVREALGSAQAGELVRTMHAVHDGVKNMRSILGCVAREYTSALDALRQYLEPSVKMAHDAFELLHGNGGVAQCVKSAQTFDSELRLWHTRYGMEMSTFILSVGGTIVPTPVIPPPPPVIPPPHKPLTAQVSAAVQADLLESVSESFVDVPGVVPGSLIPKERIETELTTQVETLTTQVGTLTTQVGTLTKQTEADKKAIDDLTETNKSLMETNKELTETNKELREIIEGLKDQPPPSSCDCEMKNRTIEEQARTIEEQNMLTKKLEHDLALLRASGDIVPSPLPVVPSSSLEIQKLTERIQMLTGINTHLEDRVTQLTTEKAAIEKQRQAADTRSTDLAERLGEEVRALISDKVALSNANDQLREQISALEELLTAFRAQSTAAEERAKMLEGEVARLTTELATLRTLGTSVVVVPPPQVDPAPVRVTPVLSPAEADLRAELVQVQAALVQVQAALTEATQKIYALQDHASGCEALAVDRGAQIDALKRDLEAARKAISPVPEVELVKQEMQNQLYLLKQQHRQEMEAAAKDKQEMEAAVAKHRQEMEAAIAKHRQEMEAAVAKHTRDLQVLADDYAEKLQALKGEHAQEVARMQAERKQIVDKHAADLTNMTASYKQEIEVLMAKLRTVTTQAATPVLPVTPLPTPAPSPAPMNVPEKIARIAKELGAFANRAILSKMFEGMKFEGHAVRPVTQIPEVDTPLALLSQIMTRIDEAFALKEAEFLRVLEEYRVVITKLQASLRPAPTHTGGGGVHPTEVKTIIETNDALCRQMDELRAENGALATRVQVLLMEKDSVRTELANTTARLTLALQTAADQLSLTEQDRREHEQEPDLLQDAMREIRKILGDTRMPIAEVVKTVRRAWMQAQAFGQHAPLRTGQHTVQVGNVAVHDVAILYYVGRAEHVEQASPWQVLGEDKMFLDRECQEFLHLSPVHDKIFLGRVVVKDDRLGGSTVYVEKL